MSCPIEINKIRPVAEKYVKKYLCDEYPYFSLIWESIADVMPESVSDKDVVSRLIEGATATFTRRQRLVLVSPKVILTLIAVIQEIGQFTLLPSEDEFVHAIQACAQSFKMKKPDAEQLSRRIAPIVRHEYAQAFQNPEQSLIAEALSIGDSTQQLAWTGSTNKQRPIRELISKMEAERRYTKADYDLYITDAVVELKHGNKLVPVKIKNYSYGVLVMCLINRGAHISAEEIYRRAWADGNEPLKRLPPKEGFSPNETIKPYVYRLKKYLFALNNFSIRHEAMGGGYICTGEFTFCLVLSLNKADPFVRPLPA